MGVLRRRVMRSAETRDVVGGSTDGGCKSQEAISTLMSRSPRLETNSGSNSSTLPPTAYHPSLMLASTELGVYIKWALLLQEQLEHVQAERAGLAQHCSRLQTDNHMLRRMLVAEDPAKYGSLCTPEGDSQECAEQTAAADEASEQDSAQTEGSNELTPTLPEAPKAAARPPCACSPTFSRKLPKTARLSLWTHTGTQAWRMAKASEMLRPLQELLQASFCERSRRLVIDFRWKSLTNLQWRVNQGSLPVILWHGSVLRVS